MPGDFTHWLFVAFFVVVFVVGLVYAAYDWHLRRKERRG